jgi:hypothetical protein
MRSDRKQFCINFVLLKCDHSLDVIVGGSGVFCFRFRGSSALSVRLNCQQAVDTTHLIDTVGVIFTDGPSMACSGDSHHRLNQQSTAQVLRCRGLSDPLASGKGDESKV